VVVKELAQSTLGAAGTVKFWKLMCKPSLQSTTGWEFMSQCHSVGE